MGSCYQNCVNGEPEIQRLTSTVSFKAKKKPAMAYFRAGPEVDDIVTMLHGSDPVRVELSRLENECREKDIELGERHAEIKGLKSSERLKEKAVEELTEELKKVDVKLKTMEAQLQSKNLELKKIIEEKKTALAAQFAAEATLRRVHAEQRDDEMPPIEAIITPLEAELKLARLEVAKLQEDNKSLDRLTKTKEAALLEAERTVQIALAKASLVDDPENKNQELAKQIEICQEENKILDKMHRQKVAEVEKLTETVHELEEAVLAGGAAANAVRDYQRKVQEINDEKRILDRELARAKVSANRVAVVVANDWKDATDKVMPVKQWLEERKFYQGEMQQLKDKLAISDRAAKAEALLKEKYYSRFKFLEERLKPRSNSTARASSQGKSLSNGTSGRMSLGGAENFAVPSSNVFQSKKINLAKSSRTISSNSLLRQVNNMPSTFDGCTLTEKLERENHDHVSGVLYDILQKEVTVLRKSCREKDQSLKDKDDAIEVLFPDSYLKTDTRLLEKFENTRANCHIRTPQLPLLSLPLRIELSVIGITQMMAKKVETLNKAMEVEAKKMRREVAAMEKEVATIRSGKEHDPRNRHLRTGR